MSSLSDVQLSEIRRLLTDLQTRVGRLETDSTDIHPSSTSIDAFTSTGRRRRPLLGSDSELVASSSSSASSASPLDVATTKDEVVSIRQRLDHAFVLIHSLRDSSKRENPQVAMIWARHVRELLKDANSLKESVNRYELRLSQTQTSMLERQSIHSGPSIAVEYLSSEHDALHRSTSLLEGIRGTGSMIMSDISRQGESLKGMKKRLLDIGNQLGLSMTFLRYIERAQHLEKWILFIGMLFIVVLIGLIYWVKHW